MTEPPARPYVLLSCAMSLDGHIDDASTQRLLLSNDADFDRVDEVRAGCDAILVGANTIRRDDPRLLVRSPDLRARRAARGLPTSPAKVALTGSGKLDPTARFFTVGEAERIVYCPTSKLAATRAGLDHLASVDDGGDPLSLPVVLADLAARGLHRLLVEGGSRVLTQFLTDGLADELHLVIAPFFIGDPQAPRFVGAGTFPWRPQHPARLVDVRRIDQVVFLRYALSDRFGGT